jgi:hypothetical protein
MYFFFILSSNEKIINESIKIYGNKYDYSKVNYINGQTNTLNLSDHLCVDKKLFYGTYV